MDWHEEAALRREERAARRAERAEIAAQKRKAAIYSALQIIGVLAAMYAFMWFGCLWASI